MLRGYDYGSRTRSATFNPIYRSTEHAEQAPRPASLWLTTHSLQTVADEHQHNRASQLSRSRPFMLNAYPEDHPANLSTPHTEFPLSALQIPCECDPKPRWRTGARAPERMLG